jgi:short-subunit dehydrogenase
MQRVRKNFETNVFSTLELIQVVLKKMMHKKQGTIIVVSSIAGRIPTSFLGPYSMTKFALSGGVAAMRDEIHQVAPDVHISLVEPGAYATGFNQRMFATKYEWMDENSYFWPIIQKLKSQDEDFKKIEEQTTQGIVKKIVKAVDAHKPHLRYVAPWYQGMYVRLLRILGK